MLSPVQMSRMVCDDNAGEQFRTSHPATGVMSEIACGWPNCQVKILVRNARVTRQTGRAYKDNRTTHRGLCRFEAKRADSIEAGPREATGEGWDKEKSVQYQIGDAFHRQSLVNRLQEQWDFMPQ